MLLPVHNLTIGSRLEMFSRHRLNRRNCKARKPTPCRLGRCGESPTDYRVDPQFSSWMPFDDSTQRRWESPMKESVWFQWKPSGGVRRDTTRESPWWWRGIGTSVAGADGAQSWGQ